MWFYSEVPEKYIGHILGRSQVCFLTKTKQKDFYPAVEVKKNFLKVWWHDATLFV